MKLPSRRCWFIDEFGVHLALRGTHARAPRGLRAHVVEPFETGGNHSVISALNWQGVHAPLLLEGAIDSEVLALWVEHFLRPHLQPGDIVIWDNVRTHKNARVLALFKAAGVQVEPLPAYSPDLNPKEECISKLKTELRRVGAETKRKLSNALKHAIAKVTPQDIRGWFTHSGYTCP